MLGYFLVVRGLTFAGHALSNIGFAGAAGAVLVGVHPVYGLLAFTVGASLAISLLGKEIRERDIAIGVIMTFALGLGILFLSLYHGYAEQAYSILFGTILGISRGGCAGQRHIQPGADRHPGCYGSPAAVQLFRPGSG